MKLTLALTVALIVAALAPACALVPAISASMTVDNGFEAYLSTDDSVQGTLIGQGGNWTQTFSFNAPLTPGVTNYLHIYSVNFVPFGGWNPAGFIGDFSLNTSDFRFANGTQALLTNSQDWLMSSTGWGSNYVAPTSLGANGIFPWGPRPGISSAAQWIWTADGMAYEAGTPRYFSTRITALSGPGVPEASTLLLALCGLSTGGFIRRFRR